MGTRQVGGARARQYMGGGIGGHPWPRSPLDDKTLLARLVSPPLACISTSNRTSLAPHLSASWSLRSRGGKGEGRCLGGVRRYDIDALEYQNSKYETKKEKTRKRMLG